jgi:Holliday junction resolvase RusA-like endonuclease
MNGREVITEPLELSLEVFVAIPKSYSKKKTEQCRLNLITPGKPDIDNYLKIILDSLNGIVYKDDAQVCKCTVSKRYDDYPRVEILIKES